MPKGCTGTWRKYAELHWKVFFFFFCQLFYNHMSENTDILPSVLLPTTCNALRKLQSHSHCEFSRTKILLVKLLYLVKFHLNVMWVTCNRLHVSVVAVILLRCRAACGHGDTPSLRNQRSLYIFYSKSKKTESKDLARQYRKMISVGSDIFWATYLQKSKILTIL